jgi:dihydroorotase-like cyclic amidohydrolase
MMLRGGRIPASGGLAEAYILVADGRIAAMGGDLRAAEELSIPRQIALSARACRRFGFADRGVLGVGAIADLVVIDPDRLHPLATEGRRVSSQTG